MNKTLKFLLICLSLAICINNTNASMNDENLRKIEERANRFYFALEGNDGFCTDLVKAINIIDEISTAPNDFIKQFLDIKICNQTAIITACKCASWNIFPLTKIINMALENHELASEFIEQYKNGLLEGNVPSILSLARTIELEVKTDIEKKLADTDYKSQIDFMFQIYDDIPDMLSQDCLNPFEQDPEYTVFSDIMSNNLEFLVQKIMTKLLQTPKDML